MNEALARATATTRATRPRLRRRRVRGGRMPGSVIPIIGPARGAHAIPENPGRPAPERTAAMEIPQ